MKLITSLIIALFTSLILIEPAFTQDFALQQLEDSPRHHEWVKVQDGDRTIHSFVAYPEVSENALSVIVIHENRGLTDWVRSFTDQLAAEGYIAIAPDLLSEYDSEHHRTSDFTSSDAARDAIYDLDPGRITRDLNAVQEYILSDPSSDGRIVVAGFCWGGSQSFRYATHAEGLSSALVFYGSAPDDEERIEKISAPVYGFYGGNDQRINATVPGTEKLMDKYGKMYEYRIYDNAGHGYMRTGDNPDGEKANVTARNQSWEWIRKILGGLE